MSNLVFLDLETTGTKPNEGCILELGIVIYDPHKREVVAQNNWVLHFNIEGREKMYVDPYPVVDDVREMHTKNGLWDECSQSQLSDGSAQDAIIDWLRAQGYEPGGRKPPMCGNTIGYFDKRWLDLHMPQVGNMFHYRSIDISGLNELAEEGLLGIPAAPKQNAHRAIDDCLSSISQLEYYLDRLVKQDGEE